MNHNKIKFEAGKIETVDSDVKIEWGKPRTNFQKREMHYFIISSSDGDVSVEMMTKKDLEEYLVNNNCNEDICFLENIENNDPNYWNNKILIIKGDICVPKPKQVITKFEI